MSFEKHILDGDKYMSLAEAELAKADWFFNRIDKYKAIQMIIQSGDSYALGKDYAKSIKSYLAGITLISNSPKLLLDYNMCNLMLSYMEMCNKNKTTINNIVLKCLDKKMIIYLQEMKNYNIIIKIYEAIAFNYEIQNNTETALKYYEEASNYAEMTKMKSTTIKLINKIAELNIVVNNKIAAFEKYKECAELCLASDLLKIKSKVYLLYSLMVVIELLNEEQFEEKMIEYKNLCPVFSNSPEYNLIRGLFLANKTKDVEYINNVIANNYLFFDKCIISILENVKNSFINA